MPPPILECLPAKFSGALSLPSKKFGRIPPKVSGELKFYTIDDNSGPLQYALQYKIASEVSYQTMIFRDPSWPQASFSHDVVSFYDGHRSAIFHGTSAVIKEIKELYDALSRERQANLAGVAKPNRSPGSCANRDENEHPQLPRQLASTSMQENRLNSEGESAADSTRSCGPLVAASSSNLRLNAKPLNATVTSSNVTDTDSTGWLGKETGPQRKQRVVSSRRQKVPVTVRSRRELAFIDDAFIESADEPDPDPVERSSDFSSGQIKLLHTNQPVAGNRNSDSIVSCKRMRLADSYSDIASPKSATLRDMQHFGFVGFANVGNSCYLNAVLQALFALPTFASDLSATIKHWIDLLADCGMATSLARYSARSVLVSLQQLLDYRNARLTKCSSLADCVDDLKDGLARFRSPQFTDYAQKDAQELLCMLLEAMEHELAFWASKIFHKQKSALMDRTVPAARVALEEMQYLAKSATCFCRSCNSLQSVTSSSQYCGVEAATLQRCRFGCISVSRWNPAESNFAFVLQVHSTCLQCNFEKCATDGSESNALLLNVVQLRPTNDCAAANGSENARLQAARQCATVQDLVDWFAVGERVQMDCEGCGARCAPHVRRRRFLRTPRVLVIVALRYRYDMHGEKLDQRFIVPPYVTLARFVSENVVCPPAWQPEVTNSSGLSDRLQSAAVTPQCKQQPAIRSNLVLKNVAVHRPLYQRAECDDAILSDSEYEGECNSAKLQDEAIRNMERINAALSLFENEELLPQIGNSSLNATKVSFECIQDTKLDDEEALRIALQHSLTEHGQLADSRDKSPDKQSTLVGAHQRSHNPTMFDTARPDENFMRLNGSFGTYPVASSPLSNRTINSQQKATDSIRCSSRGSSVPKVTAQDELSKLAVCTKVFGFSEQSARDQKLASEKLTQIDGADALRVSELEDLVEGDVAASSITTEVHTEASTSEDGAATAAEFNASCIEDATPVVCGADCTTKHSGSFQLNKLTVAGVNEDTDFNDQELQSRLVESQASIDASKCKVSSDSDEAADDKRSYNLSDLEGVAAAAHSSVSAAGVAWKGVQQIDRATHLYGEDPEFIDHILQNGETGDLPHSYRLVAVVSHHGLLLNNGHYVSDVYDANTQSWTRCDDDYLSEILEDELLEQASRNGYIFFYSCKDVVQQLEERSARQSSTRNV